MQTVFSVTIDNECLVVVVEEENFEAHAIVIVECLKHYKKLSHSDAVDLYTQSSKHVTSGGLSIAGLIAVKIHDDQTITQCDFVVEVPKKTMQDVLDYWKSSVRPLDMQTNT